MHCPRCGSKMVEMPPPIIYTSYPAQYDSIMYCGCGYSENRGRVYFKSGEEQLHDYWKEINGIR